MLHGHQIWFYCIDCMMPITHKTTYVPVLNSSKPHHIARLLTLDIVWFVFSNVTLYSALVTEVVYVISCYIGPLYIGIILYISETKTTFQFIIRGEMHDLRWSRLVSCCKVPTVAAVDLLTQEARVSAAIVLKFVCDIPAGETKGMRSYPNVDVWRLSSVRLYVFCQ